MKRLLYILILFFIASFSLESCCKFERPIPLETQECGVSTPMYGSTMDDPIDNTDSNNDVFGITDDEDDEDHDKENTSN
ncbi:MAG: hypothetical protein P8M12_02790 [Flavobacteriales bacterium]|jgi:hypothetical protein|nr:hypothetical protein [Flavobacteriales bacterium]